MEVNNMLKTIFYFFYFWIYQISIFPRLKRVQKLQAQNNLNPDPISLQKEKDILNHGVSMFVIGDDWVNYFDELRVHCDVVYLPRTPNISTTDI